MTGEVNIVDLVHENDNDQCHEVGRVDWLVAAALEKGQTEETPRASMNRHTKGTIEQQGGRRHDSGLVCIGSARVHDQAKGEE